MKSTENIGVTIDDKLNFPKHVKQAVHKAKAACNQLYFILNGQNAIPISTKLYTRIHKTYIKPIMLYMVLSWLANIQNQ